MFSPGIYNQQRSTYVGSSLGEFMQLLPQAQQRYDESRELFDTTDAILDAVDYNENDRDAVMDIIQPYKESINSAAQSGDYRALYGNASKISKKVLSDRGLKTVQSSYNNAMKQRELEAQYGKNALSFTDPSKHRSVEYDEEGNKVYNVYVPRVEERKDYDAKMVDIYGILKADGFSIDLRQHRGDIDGFLEHGKVSGISDPKVRKYLSDAYNRYIESQEGVQDYDRLRTIEGLSPEEAKADIHKRLLSVGTGMIYSDASKSYMQNPRYEEAKKGAALDEYGGNYMPVDESNTIKAGNVLRLGDLDVQDGKLVNANTYKNQIAQLEKEGFDEKVIDRGVNFYTYLGTKVLKNFVATTKWIADGLSGTKSELEIRPEQEIGRKNLINVVASINGKQPSEVTPEEIAQYYNITKRKDVGISVPIRQLEPDQRKAYNSELIGEPVKLKDGSTVVPSKTISSRKIFWKGNIVAYETIFGENGIIGRPASVDIVSEFGADNGFGFESGIVGQFIDQDGIEHQVPIEKFAGPENPAKRIETAMHQTKYNPLTHTSDIAPVTVQGNQIKVAANPITGEYTMYVNNNIDSPLTVSSQEIAIRRKMMEDVEGEDVINRLSDHAIASRVLLDKWIAESQKQ